MKYKTSVKTNTQMYKNNGSMLVFTNSSIASQIATILTKTKAYLTCLF